MFLSIFLNLLWPSIPRFFPTEKPLYTSGGGFALHDCKARGCSPFSMQNPSKNNLKRFCYNDTI
ncbi:MAG: hypothetical protein EGR21_03275 [Faecalibacterium prausnitzii]|nr:hypothetical protein [Faecalibacterium prausnitzii]